MRNWGVYLIKKMQIAKQIIKGMRQNTKKMVLQDLIKKNNKIIIRPAAQNTDCVKIAIFCLFTFYKTSVRKVNPILKLGSTPKPQMKSPIWAAMRFFERRITVYPNIPDIIQTRIVIFLPMLSPRIPVTKNPAMAPKKGNPLAIYILSDSKQW